MNTLNARKTMRITFLIKLLFRYIECFLRFVDLKKFVTKFNDFNIELNAFALK